MPQRKRPCKVTTLICDALCQLIEEKTPYDSISLQQIVNKAGVCRNSFYRNYHCKEDIFKAKFQEVNAESDRLFKAAGDISRFGILYAIATTMEHNRRFLLCFYQASPKLYLDTLVSQVESSNTPDPIASVAPEQYYLYASRAWITIGVLTEWLERGCDMPTTAIARMIDSWRF